MAFCLNHTVIQSSLKRTQLRIVYHIWVFQIFASEGNFPPLKKFSSFSLTCKSVFSSYLRFLRSLVVRLRTIISMLRIPVPQQKLAVSKCWYVMSEVISAPLLRGAVWNSALQRVCFLHTASLESGNLDLKLLINRFCFMSRQWNIILDRF